MNEIASNLGSFFGGLVACALTWRVCAFIALHVTKNAALALFIGAAMALWYANTRDGAAAASGAWIAFVIMLMKN